MNVFILLKPKFFTRSLRALFDASRPISIMTAFLFTFNTLHLAQRSHWVCEILERGCTDDEIEHLIMERHVCGISLSKFNCSSYPFFRSVLFRNLYKRFTDVQSDTRIFSEFCKLYCEIARPSYGVVGFPCSFLRNLDKKLRMSGCVSLFLLPNSR